MVKFEERDVFMNRGFQQEVKERLGTTPVIVPQVFVEGRHLGVSTIWQLDFHFYQQRPIGILSLQCYLLFKKTRKPLHPTRNILRESIVACIFSYLVFTLYKTTIARSILKLFGGVNVPGESLLAICLYFKRFNYQHIYFNSFPYIDISETSYDFCAVLQPTPAVEIGLEKMAILLQPV